MTNFDPKLIVPASKSAEFSGTDTARTAKHILLDGISNQIALFKDPKKEGRRWFQVGKTEVAISLRVNNKPLAILGTETKVAVPIDQFEAAMGYYKEEIEKGTLDAKLAEADKGIATRREKMKQTRATRKQEKEQKPA